MLHRGRTLVTSSVQTAKPLVTRHNGLNLTVPSQHPSNFILLVAGTSTDAAVFCRQINGLRRSH